MVRLSDLEEKTKQILIAQYKSGAVPSKELAEEYGVTKTSILRFLKREGVDTSPKPPLTKVQENQVVKKMDQGQEYKLLAIEYNVSVATINRLAKSRGVQKNKQPIPVQAIINGYTSQKISMANLGTSLGISKRKVKATLVANGVTIRKKDEANRIYKINHNYFDVIDTEEKAYCL